MAVRRRKRGTTKIHTMHDGYVRDNPNKIKTSQRESMLFHRANKSTHTNNLDALTTLETENDRPKIIGNSSRYGRQMKDDSEPVGVMDPDVKRVHFNIWAERAKTYAFRLAHEEMSPAIRKAVEHNLNACKLRCERYGSLTTDARERLRANMPK